MMQPRLHLALLLMPAVAVIGVLFGGGLVIAVMQSLNGMPVSGQTEPTLAAYRTVLTDPDLGRSFLLSLHIALTSTVLATALGIAAALLLRAGFSGSGVARFLFQMNLTVPHVVGAIGILYLFSQSGSLARLGHAAGLIARPADFPALVFDPHAIGIILHYVWKEVPFIGLIVLAQMQALGTDHEGVARSLGATRWQAFRHVLLPLIAPAAVRAAVIVFAFAFGAYEIPALLGSSHPQALPVLAYRSFTDVDLAARPVAMALAVVIAAMAGVMVWLSLRMARR